MFTIGDKVAYPMHGAGVIEGIEEQTILGEPRRYYILRLSHSDMKVMVPVETSGKVGVRYIVEPETLTEVTQILQSESTPMSDNWNKRNRDNMEKLKTGDLREIEKSPSSGFPEKALHRRKKDAQQRKTASDERDRSRKRSLGGQRRQIYRRYHNERRCLTKNTDIYSSCGLSQSAACYIIETVYLD